MKTHATGSLLYNIKDDSYIFTLVIPCDDYERVPFKSKAEEVSYYKRKAERMILAFADSDALDGSFKVVTD